MPRRAAATEPAGAVDVLTDSRLPHLARTFTYSVPARLADSVVTGVRVRVRLAGRLTEGFVVGPGSDFAGKLAPIESLVSPIPVLTAEILQLCRRVADHYAGSVSDVVRLAVPPRVAGVEAGWPWPERPTRPRDPAPGSWLADQSFTRAAAAGRAVRATWAPPAGSDWSGELAAAAGRVAAAGRSTVIVVPDARDVERVATAVRSTVGHVTVLTADLGPHDRYQSFLHTLSGAPVVVGTRAAAFAPVADPGLLIIWDDGDDSLAEQRAPYPHAREVLAMRSHLQECALLAAGFARTAEVQRWTEEGWLGELTAPPTVTRDRRPEAFSTADRVRSPFDQARRLPQSAVAALRAGLAEGPVLVQVARRGYLPLTACQNCRELAECVRCAGPLAVAADGAVRCRRCSATDPFRCPHCGHDRLRAVRTGAGRTAEELGRLFPGVPVAASTGEHPIARVGDQPGVVVSTPGVEPAADGGYRAGALLDAQEELWRVGLRAREEAVRRWFAAAALLSPGAPLAICAPPDDPAVQALIRWDPAGFARSELERRDSAGLPPARQVAQLDGSAGEVAEVLPLLPDGTDVLGPRPLSDSDVRVLLSSDDFSRLRHRLREIVVARAARHSGHPLRLRVDPVALD